MERILSSGTAMTLATATGDAGQLIMVAVSLDGLMRLISRLYSYVGAALVGAAFADFDSNDLGDLGRFWDAHFGDAQFGSGAGFRNKGKQCLWPLLALTHGEFLGWAGGTDGLRRYLDQLLQPSVHQH